MPEEGGSFNLGSAGEEVLSFDNDVFLVDGASHAIPDHMTRKSDGHRVPLSAFPECPGPNAPAKGEALERPSADPSWAKDNTEMAAIYHAVVRERVPNYRGAKLRVPSGLNIEEWRKVQHLLPDGSLVDCLAYGFPVGFTGDAPPREGVANHSSAVKNPLHVGKYISTELDHKALIGPYNNPPFEPWFRTNPAMTRPKKDSPDYRVILDLSYPLGHSVNSHVPLNALDDTPFDLANTMRRLGRGCLLYKVDLSRAYRQLRSDPFDWPFLGIEWKGQYYIDGASATGWCG